jgi:hypothetical protein
MPEMLHWGLTVAREVIYIFPTQPSVDISYSFGIALRVAIYSATWYIREYAYNLLNSSDS